MNSILFFQKHIFTADLFCTEYSEYAQTLIHLLFEENLHAIDSKNQKTY